MEPVDDDSVKKIRSERSVNKPRRLIDEIHLAFLTAEAINGNSKNKIDAVPESAIAAVQKNQKDE